jgi:hypothetical protein
MNAAIQPITPAAPRFIDNGDGTITDLLLRKMWTKETLSTKCVTHYEAEKIAAECRVGGHSDWQLAEVEDLFSLADRTRHSPAIDIAFFPDTHSDCYWARTLVASAPRAAWFVYFSYGVSNDFHRGYVAFVRAVRSLPPGQ